MAFSGFSFTTARGSVRLRFDEEISVEVGGRYFTLDLPMPRSVSVSDELLLFVMEGEGDNLLAYTLLGDFAFSLSSLGIEQTVLSGSVMSSAEAIRFLSRHPEVKVVADHTYYLVTTETYQTYLVDLTAREVVFLKN